MSQREVVAVSTYVRYKGQYCTVVERGRGRENGQVGVLLFNSLRVKFVCIGTESRNVRWVLGADSRRNGT